MFKSSALIERLSSVSTTERHETAVPCSSATISSRGGFQFSLLVFSCCAELLCGADCVIGLQWFCSCCVKLVRCIFLFLVFVLVGCAQLLCVVVVMRLYDVAVLLRLCVVAMLCSGCCVAVAWQWMCRVLCGGSCVLFCCGCLVVALRYCVAVFALTCCVGLLCRARVCRVRSCCGLQR